MKYILIDADTGIDDSIAILFALKRKDVRVVGITTGFGNTNARQAADNSLRLIQLSGGGHLHLVWLHNFPPRVGPQAASLAALRRGL